MSKTAAIANITLWSGLEMQVLFIFLSCFLLRLHGKAHHQVLFSMVCSRKDHNIKQFKNQDLTPCFSNSKLISNDLTWVVNAPMEITSTPVLATSLTFSSVMPPEASTIARPFM